MDAGILYIVATPIGNLSDITSRALDTLRSVDLVLCEDTRETKKLLHHYDIHTAVKAFHQHSGEAVCKDVQDLLESGNTIALVCDAGTPTISDPGGLLVEYLTTHNNRLVIQPIPGASALTAALSVCGFAAEKFLFLGFPPHKQKRKQFFEQVAASPYTVAFYESPYRIKKAIAQLTELCEPGRQLCICRELTKKFETSYRGTIATIGQMTIPEKGEFVVVVKGNKS